MKTVHECPEEVDVFTIPHFRMKELVNQYLKMLTFTNFSDVSHLKMLLENLQRTFSEFRTHEQIENKYILHKLENKLRSLSIHSSAVCKCHSDNRLTEIQELVHAGYTWASKTASERINYGVMLRKALEEFTDTFLPHMEEEEEVFQPMLIKYFTTKELKDIKAVVIEQHLAQNSELPPTGKDDDQRPTSTPQDENELISSTVLDLPDEVVLQIFSYLMPLELSRCAGVCTRWNNMAFDSSLWTTLNPVQWAQGNWSTFQDETLADKMEEGCDGKQFLFDEDADIDEVESPSDQDDQQREAYLEWKMLVKLCDGLLPRVGHSILVCNLAHSKGLTSRLMQKFLTSCPNLKHLDVSYTAVSDAAFKGLCEGSCTQLRHLDLTACARVTDKALERLSKALTCRHSVQCEPAEQSDTPTLVDLHKWLRDAVLTDCKNISQPRGTGDGKCCRKSSGGGPVQVSRAAWSHYKSSDIKQLIQQVRNHYRNQTVQEVESGNKCCSLCQDCDGLHFLSLSGCYQITGDGLRYLSKATSVRALRVLDLSGCMQIDSSGLRAIVSQCPRLDHAELYYCDNIPDDPFHLTASGCQNVGCSSRHCCRLGE